MVDGFAIECLIELDPLPRDVALALPHDEWHHALSAIGRQRTGALEALVSAGRNPKNELPQPERLVLLVLLHLSLELHSRSGECVWVIVVYIHHLIRIRSL